MKKIIVTGVFVLGLSLAAYGGQNSKIELTDGSVIEGEVVSLDNGTYTLNTDSIGKVKVEAAKIHKITTSEGSDSPDASFPSTETIKMEVNRIGPKIAGNPEMTKDVSGLLSDPQFMEVMKDPEVINAARSQDIKTLMANPKFRELINNPKIKELSGKLKDQKE
jgi:hypothetical protein